MYTPYTQSNKIIRSELFDFFKLARAVKEDSSV